MPRHINTVSHHKTRAQPNRHYGQSSIAHQLERRKRKAMAVGETSFDFDGDLYVLHDGKFVVWWAVRLNSCSD
jgi:hypothetical protein